MERENFENLNVWKKAMEICLFCYKLAREFPPEERYALADQFRRAAVSIPSNTAEGYSRKTIKEVSRYADIATGSAYEVMTQADIALASGYIALQDKERLFTMCKEYFMLANGYLNYKKGRPK